MNDLNAVFIAKRYPDKINREESVAKTIRVLKRFDFQSELQRMSILCEIQGRTFCLVKGAPEVIANISNNVPPEFIPLNNENAK